MAHKKIDRYGTYNPRSHHAHPTSIERRSSVNIDGTDLPQVKNSFTTFYTMMHLLGEGASAKVFLAKHNKTGAYVAVKVIPKQILISNKDLAREIRVLKSISHQYIVQLRDVFITTDYIQIIMEAIEGCELFEEICQRRNFTELDVKDISAKLLDAMGYLHSKGIVHRDLKPENIMFIKNEEGKNNLKIIDFGFSGTSDELINSTGTLGYKAPEILKGLPNTTKSDIWSVGVIIYILLVGFPPFFSYDDYKDVNMLMCAPFWSFFNDETEQLLDSIKNGEIYFPQQFWENMEIAKQFVQCLLKVNPEERASALEALAHPWLKPHDEIIEMEPEKTPHELNVPITSTTDQPTNAPSVPAASAEPESEQRGNRLHSKVLLHTATKRIRDTIPRPSFRDLAAVMNQPLPTPDYLMQPFIEKSGIEEIDLIISTRGSLSELSQTSSLSGHQDPSELSYINSLSGHHEHELSQISSLSGYQDLSELAQIMASGQNPPLIAEKTDEIYFETYDKDIKTSTDKLTDKSSDSNPKKKNTKKNLKLLSTNERNNLSSSSSNSIHNWKSSTGTQWCKCCNDFIWGISKDTALKCHNCRIVIHILCKSKLQVPCRSPKAEKSANPTGTLHLSSQSSPPPSPRADKKENRKSTKLVPEKKNESETQK